MEERRLNYKQWQTFTKGSYKKGADGKYDARRKEDWEAYKRDWDARDAAAAAATPAAVATPVTSSREGGGAGAESSASAALREIQKEERNHKVLEILRKVNKRYWETDKNAVMVVNPDLDTMRPLLRGTSVAKIGGDFYKKTTLQPSRYHERFMAILYVGVNLEKLRMSVECEFRYLINGKGDPVRSYGQTIGFRKKDILQLGDLTHETVWRIVRKMRTVGAGPFRGIRPMYWSELMAMEEPVAPPAAAPPAAVAVVVVDDLAGDGGGAGAGGAGAESSASAALREIQKEERNHKVLEILRKVNKRYWETDKNAVMVMNPDLDTMRPLLCGTSFVKVGEEFDKKTSEQPHRYHERFMVTVYIGVNLEMYLMSVRCEFCYLVEGEEDRMLSYGRTIGFRKKDILQLGDLTHETVWRIVRKMRTVGAGPFRGIRPMYWSELMAMEEPAVPPAAAADDLAGSVGQLALDGAGTETPVASSSSTSVLTAAASCDPFFEGNPKHAKYAEKAIRLATDIGARYRGIGSMLVDPEELPFRPCAAGDDIIEVKEELKAMAKANPAQYDERYIVYLDVGTCIARGSVTITCEFHYFRKGRIYHLRSFGDRIAFNARELAKHGDITHDTLAMIMNTMKQKGRDAFTGIRRMNLKRLKALPDTETPAASTSSASGGGGGAEEDTTSAKDDGQGASLLVASS